jgi:uncharacterized repeat protein (TIGR03803 family)
MIQEILCNFILHNTSHCMTKNLLVFFVGAILAGNASFSQAPELWGITINGGNYNEGTIFKTDGNGENQSVIYSFEILNPGMHPLFLKLCETPDGKLYGMTGNGGINGYGVLFEYNIETGVYNRKVDFDGVNSGKYPEGSLIQTASGKLYGMTTRGGMNDLGVLFEYDPFSDTIIKKIDFNGTDNGANPSLSLMLASNGKLYGITSNGGAYNCGVLFEYDPSNGTFTKKVDFDDVNYGKKPIGDLLQANNGKIYGLTNQGGANNYGVLFEYDPVTDTIIKKFDFDDVNYGSNALSGLIQAADGKLYGTMNMGGANSFYGIIFSYDISADTLVKLFDFDGSSNGGNPQGSLLEGNNGFLYGTAFAGGINNMGVLFKFDPVTGNYNKIYDFIQDEGANPKGTLIQASNGKLYGTTSKGGLFDYGVIFEFDISIENYKKKIDLNQPLYGTCPRGTLLYASNGKFYGMTVNGGIYDYGVLYEFDPVTGKYKKIFDFDGLNNGKNPSGSLCQATNSKIYGLVTSGGAYNFGTLIEYDPITNTFTKKIDFDGINNGGLPAGSLIQASNGKLYGMAMVGGSYFLGTLFEYNPIVDTLIVKVHFDGFNTGSMPTGNLTQASNGKLYGMTYQGGAMNIGVLFEYDINADTIAKKLDFDGINYGGYPSGSLTESVNGKLYGMNSMGGSNFEGVLFEYDINTDTGQKVFDFDGSNYGSTPEGSLLQASNGKLYGMTSFGGINNLGTLFEYDPVSDTLIKKLDFDRTNGARPGMALIETNICYPTNSTIDAIACESYTSPSGNHIYDASGTYIDTIPNSCGADSLITINLTINTNQIGDTIATACDSFSWYGNTYTSNGDYTHTLQTINGCDSVITLHLTVNNSETGDTTVTACDTYSWYGNSYNTSGDYTHTLQTINGCDSIVTLHLTVNNSQTGDTTVTACDTYSWYSNIYTSSGDYTHTLQTIKGCDSVITLHLTLNSVDITVSQNGDTLIANQNNAVYQWINCATYLPVLNATKQFFTPDSSGEYAVEITYHGCTSTSDCYEVNVPETDLCNIRIFPNPSYGEIFIDPDKATIVSIKLFDTAGKEIYANTNRLTNLFSLHLNLASGVYIMSVKTDCKIQNYKLVIFK